MTMDLFSVCVAPTQARTLEDDTTLEEEPLECNYDKDPTALYQALEAKAFVYAIDQMEQNTMVVQDQIRTWVTRYEKDGRIRWSMLPLHAALIFKAPIKVIELLTKAYPKAIRCTNDQKALPLHLAFKHGASDNVLHLLLKAFPEAMFATDHKSRTPLECAKDGDGWKKGEILEIYLRHTLQQKQDTLDLQQTKAVTSQLDQVKSKLTEEEHKVMDLEAAKAAKDEALKKKDSDMRLLGSELKKSQQTVIDLENKLVEATAALSAVTAASQGRQKSFSKSRSEASNVSRARSAKSTVSTPVRLTANNGVLTPTGKESSRPGTAAVAAAAAVAIAEAHSGAASSKAASTTAAVVEDKNGDVELESKLEPSTAADEEPAPLPTNTPGTPSFKPAGSASVSASAATEKRKGGFRAFFSRKGNSKNKDKQETAPPVNKTTDTTTAATSVKTTAADDSTPTNTEETAEEV